MNMDLIFDKFPNELLPFDFDTYFHSEIEVRTGDNKIVLREKPSI